MINRNKRGIGSMRARLAIAAAVLVGGGAAGAVALSSHGTSAIATSAGFSSESHHHTMGEATALSEAFNQWGSSQTRSFTTLSDMTSMRTFNQVWQHHVQFAAQRGLVVFATPKFLIVRSFNGALHAWWLTGRTAITDVSSTTSGMLAMTGNTVATTQAMTFNNMVAATNVMAGSTTALTQLVTPVVKPTTITIATGGQLISITIANITATTTTTTTTTSTTTTTPTATTSFTQPIFATTRGIQRGDLVFVAGTRTNGALKAKLVLFAAPLNTMPSATTTFQQSGTSSTGMPIFTGKSS